MEGVAFIEIASTDQAFMRLSGGILEVDGTNPPSLDLYTLPFSDSVHLAETSAHFLSHFLSTAPPLAQLDIGFSWAMPLRSRTIVAFSYYVCSQGQHKAFTGLEEDSLKLHGSLLLP